MPTITDTLKDAEGNALANCAVVIRSLIGPHSSGSALISKTRCGTRTGSDGALSVVLAPGQYRAEWKCGTVPNAIVFDVPEADGEYVMREQRSGEDLGYTSGVLRWGASASESLDASGILGLGNSITRSLPDATLTLPAGVGTYKFLAWPDRIGSPTAVTGFWDSESGHALVMADADDGFEHEEDGWSYQLVPVNGVAHRVYRTKYALGSAVPIVLS